jgi:predicted ArsR family transcriptional regulator
MQDTRQQILEILKRYGEVTVQELSTELGLTSVTVRHHLEILRSEGFITEPEIRRSSRPGRPRYVYRLTSTAADLFPNNYSGLASALLDSISECVMPEAREQVYDRAAKRMADKAGSMPQALGDRLESAITFMNQQGFVSRWEKEGDQYVVYVSSCPYHHVSADHPETCQIDKRLVQMLTGAHVEQVQTGARHGNLCVYKIKAG